MATPDPTEVTKLRNLLDELSDNQAANAIYFSWGITQQQIADIRNVTLSSVKNSLEQARKKLGLNNLDTLRTLVTFRVQMCIWLACDQHSGKRSK